jgi:ethanolamine ammonia-lyase small subunit
MRDDGPDLPVAPDWPAIVAKVRARTPARLLVGRAGAAYRTATQLDLREAHAAARDAVRVELNLAGSFTADFVRRWNLFEVSTEASSKDEYLLRPDLGRRFAPAAREALVERCPPGCDLIVAIGDGLSVTAVEQQVPRLLPLLHDQAESRGWKVGPGFVVRHCRVGILNEIGTLLQPRVAVLLIGERPGLATAESLSAYMAYRPDQTHSDANRNLISNIHARGVTADQAASRVLHLAHQMMATGASGFQLREELQPADRLHDST